MIDLYHIEKVQNNSFSIFSSQINPLREILQLENWSLIGSSMFFNGNEVD